MIVTDLDGTLLRPDKTVSDRTLAAIRAAQSAGILVIPATGRSVVDMPVVLPEPLHELAVCSNGAVVYDAAADRVLLERPITAAVVQAAIEGLLALVPDASFATLVNAGYDLLPGPGYIELMAPGDHGRDLDALVAAPLADLFHIPAVKLIARHARMELHELYAACEQVAHVGVLPTTSGVPFIEMSAAGVSKATTLALLAEERGIDAADVVVFGDSANDIEMITWAGLGIAMGNALPAVLAAADQVAPQNTDDGVAVVIERLLGLRAPAS